MPIDPATAKQFARSNEIKSKKPARKRPIIRTVSPTRRVLPQHILLRLQRVRATDASTEKKVPKTDTARSKKPLKAPPHTQKKLWTGFIGACLVGTAKAHESQLTSPATSWQHPFSDTCPAIDWEPAKSGPQAQPIAAPVAQPNPLCPQSFKHKLADIQAVPRQKKAGTRLVEKTPGELFVSSPEEVISQEDVPTVLDETQRGVLEKVLGLKKRNPEINTNFYQEDIEELIKSPQLSRPLKKILSQFLQIIECSPNPSQKQFQVVFYESDEEFDVDQPHSHLVAQSPSYVHILSLTDTPQEAHCTRILGAGNILILEPPEETETDKWYRVKGKLRTQPTQPRKISVFQGDKPHIGPKAPISGRRVMFVLSDEQVEYAPESSTT